jgi:hypothetical protein
VSCLSIPQQVSAVLKAQRRRETVGGWADMPDELLAKALELLKAAGRQEGGLGFSQTSATVRLVTGPSVDQSTPVNTQSTPATWVLTRTEKLNSAFPVSTHGRAAFPRRLPSPTA